MSIEPIPPNPDPFAVDHTDPASYEPYRQALIEIFVLDQAGNLPRTYFGHCRGNSKPRPINTKP